jgi:hypothetical protein
VNWAFDVINVSLWTFDPFLILICCQSKSSYDHHKLYGGSLHQLPCWKEDTFTYTSETQDLKVLYWENNQDTEKAVSHRSWCFILLTPIRCSFLLVPTKRQTHAGITGHDWQCLILQIRKKQTIWTSREGCPNAPMPYFFPKWPLL